MGMVNINSSVTPKEEDILFAVNRTGTFSSLYFDLPVYLVDPPLMDRIYPPERRRFLDPRCVKSFMREMDETFSDISPREFPGVAEEMWERLQRCLEPSSAFVAVGVYLPDSHEARETVQKATGFPLKPGRCIFICPERVQGWVEDKENGITPSPASDFRFLFAKVLIHELAHAYMDQGKGTTEPWERVMEESLANAFAYRNLAVVMGERERYLFERVAACQPLEYRGYRFFVSEDNLVGPSLEALGKSWGNRWIFSPHALVPPLLLLPFIWNIPYTLRRRLPRWFWEALPHPWDEILRDLSLGHFPRRAIPRNLAPVFWKNLALAVLRLLT